MKFEFKPSFDRSVKSLSLKNKKEIKELCFSLIDVLSGESSLPPSSHDYKQNLTQSTLY